MKNEFGLAETIIVLKEFYKYTSFKNRKVISRTVKQGSIYYIFIYSPISREEALRCVYHELIHIKQLVEGQLIPIDKNHLIWKNDTFDVRKLDYDELPWEKEAFDMCGIF